MDLRLRRAGRCETQYDIVEAGAVVGQVIATVLPRWRVIVVAALNDGARRTLSAPATSRYDAIRVRKRLIISLGHPGA